MKQPFRLTLLLLALTSLFLNACATQRANLQDLSTTTSVTRSPDGTLTTNTTTRTITTRLSGQAWFSSAQTLEKFRAVQTDKSQSIGASSLEQRGATNTVGVLNATKSLIEEINKLKEP